MTWVLRHLSESEVRAEWSRMFAVTCWWLWKWRNERSFKESPSIPIDPLAFLLTRVGEIQRVMSKEGDGMQHGREGRQEVFVRWKFPLGCV